MKTIIVTPGWEEFGDLMECNSADCINPPQDCFKNTREEHFIAINMELEKLEMREQIREEEREEEMWMEHLRGKIREEEREEEMRREQMMEQIREEEREEEMQREQMREQIREEEIERLMEEAKPKVIWPGEDIPDYDGNCFMKVSKMDDFIRLSTAHSAKCGMPLVLSER